MKTFRLILGILALIPLALLTDAILLHPDSYGENSAGELIYLACGVPILILNLWAWGYPRLIEVLFLGKNNVDESPTGQSGSGNPQ
jgi:hypothetical protein